MIDGWMEENEERVMKLEADLGKAHRRIDGLKASIDDLDKVIFHSMLGIATRLSAVENAMEDENMMESEDLPPKMTNKQVEDILKAAGLALG